MAKKTKNIVVSVPVELTTPVAGEVMQPDSVTVITVPNGNAGYNFNYQLPAGRYQTQASQDGKTFEVTGEVISPGPGFAYGFPIDLKAGVAWQIVFVGL